MKRNTQLMAFLLLFITSSCAMLSEERSFIDEMDYETDGFFVPGQDFAITPGDYGQAYWNQEDLRNRTPASALSSEERMHSRSLLKELRKRESRLSESEYREYRRHSEYLTSDSEKIYYLKLPRSQRREYLSGKSLNYTYDSMPNRRSEMNLPSIYDRRSGIWHGVIKGMKKQEVVGAWGRPERVDVAGDPHNENERWVYRRGGKSQVVYFENGTVNGWTID